ncbi:hypothetical protein ACPF7Z_02870 [Halomonas sp. GXIMD04776]|uniref:hypothetical protein n=1 Tax=Halomonas sp. GXIMD04776 TaxID=3415605 RepID=UPI003C97F6BF
MESSWALFLGGLGVGSALTAFIQHILAQRAKQQDLRLSELKEAFTGFLAAFAKMNEEDSSRESGRFWIVGGEGSACGFFCFE